VFPGVGILEEGVVMAIAIRSWLIAVHLSLPEEFSVVVTGLAALHFLSHTFSSFHRVRESKDGSVIALFIVCSKGRPLMSGLVLLHIASHVVPC